MVERLFPIINDIRRHDDLGRRARFYFIISLIVFLIAFSIVYNIHTKILGMLEEKNIYRVPLCKKSLDSGPSSILEEWETRKPYVPDYNSKIDILTPEKIKVNSKLEFGVKFKDTGIVNYENPYYYILLVNPQGNVEAIFPHFFAENSVQPDCRDYPGDITRKYDKWEEWKYSNYQTKIFATPTDKGTAYFTREHLMGNVSGVNILFTHVLDKEGEWTVKVVLFDENYKDRGYGLDEDFQKKPMKLETAKIYAYHDLPKKEDIIQELFLNIGKVLSLFGVFFILPYYILKRFGERIGRNIRDNIWGYVVIIILIAISVILTKYF